MLATPMASNLSGGGLRRDRDDALGRGVGGAPLRAGKVSKIQNDAT